MGVFGYVEKLVAITSAPSTVVFEFGGAQSQGTTTSTSGITILEDGIYQISWGCDVTRSAGRPDAWITLAPTVDGISQAEQIVGYWNAVDFTGLYWISLAKTHVDDLDAGEVIGLTLGGFLNSPPTSVSGLFLMVVKLD